MRDNSFHIWSTRYGRLINTLFIVACLCCSRGGWAAVPGGYQTPGSVPGPSSIQCLDCHDDYLFAKQFPQSIHGRNGCESCHDGVTDAEKHMLGGQKPALVSCAECHASIATEYKDNYHYLHQDFRCYDCHRDIHALQTRKMPLKKAVLDGCTECHANEEYVHSGHGLAVSQGNQDAATCSDCHGLHSTKVYHTSYEYPAEAREFYNSTCIRCHGDERMMERNGLSASVVRYYEKTYHGKVQGVGYPTRVAGCADCHTLHNILPKDDPSSTIHPDNLVNNCGKCHEGFHPRFVLYRAHPDYSDRAQYASLYWTNVFMITLLVATFLFFWVHAILWWRKTYWDKDYRERMGILPQPLIPGAEGIRLIQRFSGREIVVHILLVVSFFTLVLTGFPLKYHSASWARTLIEMWGGAHNAGNFHRAGAIVLFVLFFYILIRSLRFLFTRNSNTAGWKDRLFGSESLFPNMKDWEDMKGMFKWFFNRGEQPRFDRWTYWEKFDFLAVFWGMAVIGGSGIFLMAPELTSYLFPGWVLNIAALLHSEEALLAALFIFTVHFFNTHLIPGKFPMDRTIFTGTYSLEKMHEEKPLEYERLVKEDKIEGLKKEHPNIYNKLAAAVFGYASLLLGLFLAILILWSVITLD